MKRWLLTFLWLITINTYASVPGLINYQGKLTDANGEPLVTGEYNLTFKIYESIDAETAKWSEVHSAVPVVKGFFNVILGGVAPITSAFDTENAYLEITVNDGAPISPRQRVLSSPYALHAEYAKHGVPTGAVMPFDLTSCPDGWTVYTLAYGRFIRGIDKDGTTDPDGERSPGHLQEDVIKSHTHLLPNVQTFPSGANSGPHSPWVASSSSKSSGDINEGPAIETRPKNVALLYCRKD